MCAQYIIKANLKNLSRQLDAQWPDFWEDDIDLRVLPYREGPVLVRQNQQLQFKSMSYSLVPTWAKEKRVKFATHNARVETVAEKPTWKRPFVSQRCLVPLSEFIEPIYEGEWAGNMVRFHRADDKVLMAAGIWDQWIDKKSGEIFESYAILTDKPDDFIEKTGHDRTPIFLGESAYEAWVAEGKKDPMDLLALLAGERAHPDYGVRQDRPMKSGWEKRK